MSDPLGLTARPLDVVVRRSEAQAVEEVARVAALVEADRVIVGLPRRTDGRVGEAAHGAEAFAAQLKVATGLPVELWDERFTTAIAQRALIEAGVRRERRREAVDKVAAALMLQSYLDAHRSMN